MAWQWPRRKRTAQCGRPARARAACWLQPRIEQLEDRQLLSVAQPNGFEFQVNKYTTGNEQYAKVASDSAGDFVVAWSADSEDGSNMGIYAQRYKSTGAGQNEFKVNSYTTNNESHPAVAMDSAGDFVVVWQSSYEDHSGYGIYAQRYNSSGAVVGSEFRVNTFTSNNQLNPAVAMDSAGDFVVTWQSFYQDGSGYGIYAQQYNSAGTPQASEFQVNADTLSNQTNPSVAMDSAGDFVVAWQSLNEDGSLYGVYAQQFTLAGTPEGEFQVNTATANNQGHPAVAMDSQGDFAVAWQSYGQDGSQYGIFAQRFSNARVPQGSEFQVNTFTTGYQRNPSVAMDSAGDMIIAWQSSNEDVSQYGVYAQRYDSTGLVQQSEFLVNTFTTGNQARPSAAMDSAGDFIIAWQSYGEDPSQYGVYAQRYLAEGTPPVLTLLTQPLSFIAQQAPEAIDPNIELTDTESQTISSATVTISSGFDPAQDVLHFSPQNNISGSFNATTGAFTLTGIDTLADYQSALESVTYYCAHVDKTTSTRTVSFVVNDGTNFSNLPTRTINLLESGPATHLVLLNEPPKTVAAGTGFGFTVAAEDALGNLVGGFSDAVTIVLGVNPNSATVGGTATVAASGGLAVFDALTLNVVGTGYVLDAVSGSLTTATATSLAVTAGVATQLILLNQPPSTIAAGATFALTAVAEDVDGNLATGFSGSATVALANNPGSSTVGGTSTVSASNGRAVFSNLSLNKAGTGYTLIIKSPDLGSATTSGIKVIPGAASQVAINPPLATNITVDAPFGFTASVEDAEGNVVTSYSGNVSVAISTNPVGGTLSGTTSSSSTSGVAVFSGLSLNSMASGYGLSVATGTVSPLILGPFNVTAQGVATHLVVVQGPATVAPGAAFGVTVEAADDFGALDISFQGGVSIALANNVGQSNLSGTLAATASAGVAVFAGLSLNNPGLGYTLATTSSGLTADITSPFNVVGTLTINGTASSNNVQVTFVDATDFQVVLNGGAPVTYSTAAATKFVYNGPSGTMSQLIYSDIFNTYTATQSLTSTDMVAGGFEFDANDVLDLYVYATNGKSTATVTVGSGSGNNFYVGDAALDYSYIADPVRGSYSELAGFASEALTGSAGTTYAYVYSMSNATFVGDPDGSTFESTSLSLTLSNFSQVYAVGAEDGTDFMTLHTEGGSFVGQPSFSYVSGTTSGAPFFVGALYAANVVALATNPTDSAFFYSYPGDTFNGQQTSSVLSGDATGFANFSTFQVRTTSFQSLTVLESGSGTDIVNLTAPQNATFTETATASTLAVGGVALITVDTFFGVNGTLAAVSSQVNVTGDSTNTAYLYDSPGDNSLDVLGSTATLTTPVNTVVVSKFGALNAFDQNGTLDTVHKQAVDLALQTIGNWTSV